MASVMRMVAAMIVGTATNNCPRRASTEISVILFVVIKDDILRQRRIVIKMDEGLAYANTGDTALQSGLDNLESGGGGETTYIHCLPPSVSGVATSPLGQVPLTGTIGAVHNKGNASLLPHPIHQSKKAPVHIIDRTGRDAFLELRRGEILTHSHREFHQPKPSPAPQTPRERPSSLRQPHGQTQEQSRHSRNKWCG